MSLNLVRRIVGLVALLAAVASVVPGSWVFFRYQGVIYSTPELVPTAPVAIVLGAAVRPDGEPSWMLADRVDAAVELYKIGKVQRILMTGDNSTPDYDEVTAMKRYAVEQGAPAERVNLLREAVADVVSYYEINLVHPLPNFLGDPVNLETQNQ